jgi:hypothetical protein
MNSKHESSETLTMQYLVELFLVVEVHEDVNPLHQHRLLLASALGRIFRVVLQLEP